MIDAKQARENVKNFAMEEYAMPLANKLLECLECEIKKASAIGKTGINDNYFVLHEMGAGWIADEAARIVKKKLLSLGFTVEQLTVGEIKQRCGYAYKDGKAVHVWYAGVYDIEFFYDISWKD